MPGIFGTARALCELKPQALERASRRLLKPLNNNFVERPWGGLKIREFKGLCPLPAQTALTGLGLGEAFELAAFDEDAEARSHPSVIRFADGSQVSLAVLLEHAAQPLLGEAFARSHGARFPLLPKVLDVKELLSVQSHPEGNTEVYVIIDAEPGASLRLGFCEDIDAEAFKAELSAGRRRQETLLAAVDTEPQALQRILSPWMAQRAAPLEALHGQLPVLADETRSGEVARLLSELKALYWRVLDAMNTIPVSAGQVIYNANPLRITQASGKAPSAEVHALGNPEGKEILALEIRRPGPTFRAWDNVRFPIRDIDIQAAFDALNLRHTEAKEFIVEPQALPGNPRRLSSVQSEHFSLEHFRPSASAAVELPAGPPHALHAIRGAAVLTGADGAEVGRLRQGESAIVPVGVGAYRVTSTETDTEIVKVDVPLS